MKLGLWMSPMHFNPASETYQRAPEWACTPVGDGTAAYNVGRPGVELERGRDRRLGTGGDPARRGAASARRSRAGGSATSSSTSSSGSTAPARATCTSSARRSWRCSTGSRPSTPRSRFQIDETNDYRLFPFESVARGPSLVPERLARARPPAAQPLEPRPLRAELLARPALPRRRANGSAIPSTR